MLSARVAFLFLSCTVLGQYPQPINPYPYMPYPYQIFPYPPPYPSTPDPYAHIPTEIIDLDENVILPETATFGAVAEEPQITILKNTQQHVTSNSAPSKTVHVFESKPIQTVIRRTIVTDGRDGQKVISINLLNGKEVTTSTTEAAKVESSEEEDKDDKDEDDGSDPKPINSWLFPG